VGASPGRAQLAQTKSVTAGGRFAAASTRVPVDVEIELWPNIPMGKPDLDVEGKSNIADSQYKSTVKFITITSGQLILRRV
jgi:hypothetical protein